MLESGEAWATMSSSKGMGPPLFPHIGQQGRVPLRLQPLLLSRYFMVKCFVSSQAQLRVHKVDVPNLDAFLFARTFSKI